MSICIISITSDGKGFRALAAFLLFRPKGFYLCQTVSMI